MRIEITEALWLETRESLTLTELAEASGLPQELLRQLVDLGALPVSEAAPANFGAECLDIVHTAQRLHHDLEIDTDALAVVLRLLARIRKLETEMRALQAQLPRHL